MAALAVFAKQKDSTIEREKNMKTKLFYSVCDEYTQAYLYESKEAWLESARYNLDNAVEYEDITEEQSNLKFEELVNNRMYTLQANGFTYAIDEVLVFYQNNEVVIVYDDYEKEVRVFKWLVDSYCYDEDCTIKRPYIPLIAEMLKSLGFEKGNEEFSILLRKIFRFLDRKQGANNG